MRILLTNDDGIEAPGIRALYGAIESLGEVLPIAPRTPQSAAGHGITFDRPLMSEEVTVEGGMSGIAIHGRPADCVKVGLRTIWEERYGPGSRPDVTISGMNSGANVGVNIIYSGTVAAAIESAFLGVPAIAVSLHLGAVSEVRYARAAQIAREVIDRVLAHPLDPHGVVNINVPRIERDDAPTPPVRVVSMNPAPGVDTYERRESPYGQVYYWSDGSGMDFTETMSGSDVEALNERFVTVTPLSYVMTDQDRMETWRSRLEL